MLRSAQLCHCINTKIAVLIFGVFGLILPGFVFSQNNIQSVDKILLDLPNQNTTKVSPIQTPKPDSSVSTKQLGDTITIDLPGLPEGATPLEMVWIEPGTFMMGSPDNERGHENDEAPLHEVEISEGFYIGKYEVTQAQWNTIIDWNNSRFQGYPNRPIERVRWDNCQEYIVKLNELGRNDLEFRLPTEAEWEYSCRAGTTTRYSFGDALECTDERDFCQIMNQYMWWSGNNKTETKDVGLKSPNLWGLYDMHGNVFEYCQDYYDRLFYTVSPKINPINNTISSDYVYRGGSWENGANALRSSHRGGSRSGTDTLGFRVAASISAIAKNPNNVTPEVILSTGNNLIINQNASFQIKVYVTDRDSDKISINLLNSSLATVVSNITTGSNTIITINLNTSIIGSYDLGFIISDGYYKINKSIHFVILDTKTPTPTNTVTPTITPIPGIESIIVDLPGIQKNAIPLEMIWIDPGTFMMGSPDTEIGRSNNEGPVHPVEITQGFYMGKYEVTNAQYVAYLNAKEIGGTYYGPIIQFVENQWTVSEGYEDFPITRENWHQAKDFCLWLTGLVQNYEGRLPTEAEWEYACRAGSTTNFSFGEVENCLTSGYGCPILDQFIVFGYFNPSIAKVGTKYPNNWGLYNMHGNIKEWCLDYYSNTYYEVSPLKNPSGPSNGNEHVLRGGSFSADFYGVRSAVRMGWDPLNTGVGFRCVLTSINNPDKVVFPSSTITPTFTNTFTQTPTNSNTPTVTPTSTPSSTPTVGTPTATPTPTTSYIPHELSWVDKKRYQNIVYFLFNEPAHIERYDLESQQWLHTISLNDISNFPNPTRISRTVDPKIFFTVDELGIYVCYTTLRSTTRPPTEIYRISHNTGEIIFLRDVNAYVSSIFTYGSYLYITHNRNESIMSFYKENGLYIDDKNFSTSLNGITLDSVNQKIIAQGSNHILQISLLSNGKLGNKIENYNDKTGGSKNYLFPDNSRVVNKTGVIYSTIDLSYISRFEVSLDDIIFYEDLPIILSNGVLYSYSNTLIKTGSYTPNFKSTSIDIYNNLILLFSEDVSRGVQVSTIPLNLLTPDKPGKSINPEGLAYNPSNIILDSNRILYLLSKENISIFRWSIIDNQYLETIPLLGTSNVMDYSLFDHSIYVGYTDGRIMKINLNQSDLKEEFYAISPHQLKNMTVANQFLLISDFGGWGNYNTIGPKGIVLDSEDLGYPTDGFTWSSINKKAYFISTFSPRDLHYQSINADGTLGIEKDSPYHDSIGMTLPIRVSPDGSVVLLGSGSIYNADSLEQLESLSNEIVDGTWLNNQLYTIRKADLYTQIQNWNSDYNVEKAIEIKGTPLRILSNDNILIVVTLVDNIPTFIRLSENLQIVDGIINTFTPTNTNTQNPTTTNTPTITYTHTFTPSLTPFPSFTPTPTATYTPSPTITFTPTPTFKPLEVGIDSNYVLEFMKDSEAEVLIYVNPFFRNNVLSFTTLSSPIAMIIGSSGSRSVNIRLDTSQSGQFEFTLRVQELNNDKIVNEVLYPVKYTVYEPSDLIDIKSPTYIPELGDTIIVDIPGLSEGAKPLEFVWIEPGSFIMGSNENERGRDTDEGPVHEVQITKGFYMSKYEITQAQWETITFANPSLSGRLRNNDNYPVERISWKDCQEFIKILNKPILNNVRFRLPTEAEWEYACRAGTTSRFSFGEALECDDTGSTFCEIFDQYMWWNGSTKTGGSADIFVKEVGLKQPNSWGLFDMHGNVAEWCQDWYSDSYFENTPIQDPAGPNSGTYNIIRGGGFSEIALKSRSASRDFAQPDEIRANLGLRLVLSRTDDLSSDTLPVSIVPTPRLRSTVTNTPNSSISFTPTPTPTATFTPSPTITFTPTPEPIARKVDEIVLAQGTGGSSLVQIRNFDVEAGQPQNAILDSYRVLSPGLVNRIGGGIDRAVHLSVGDINHDGKDDLIHTFGQVTSSSPLPNLVIPMDAETKQVIGHSFTAFPSGNGAVGYASGELFTAVGDFINDGENLLAVAQGIGSRNGLVRLFRYTGNPAPNAWQIVAQFQPLDDRPAQNNANGGVTIAAGDVDGDGKDELLAGQTNSDTSLTQFTVIDLDDPGNPVRHNFTAFPPGFRGLGGVELVVADIDGDGQTEMIASILGNAGTNDTGNTISVIRPVVVNQQITGFTRPDASIIKIIGDDSLNPGGALHIDAGEMDGDLSNGGEIVFSSGKGAMQSFYRVMKMNYLPNNGENGLVESFQFLTGPPRNTNVLINAFSGNTNPSSGEVIIKRIDSN